MSTLAKLCYKGKLTVSKSAVGEGEWGGIQKIPSSYEGIPAGSPPSANARFPVLLIVTHWSPAPERESPVIGRDFHQGVVCLNFFNKGKTNKHKEGLCLKLVTDWIC